MENNIKKTILIEAKECIEMGKISKGEVLLKGYLDFNNDPEISSTLAKIYIQRGDLKQALEILKNQDYNYFSIFESLSEVYIKLEKYDKLYNLWKKSKNRNFQDLNLALCLKPIISLCSKNCIKLLPIFPRLLPKIMPTQKTFCFLLK